ncbi:MAG: substrate-binding domain-containing protein [Alphaproteobacteria bacterium]|jgi:simple sugar transport system substrate-binding protein/ribose transport system substrate-binding protein|nr:substrate-binding domain-containing protein [Alphaproteobacteria bacterium]
MFGFKHLAMAGVAVAALLGSAGAAQAFDLGIIAFQMSSETHARVANAAQAAAKEKGWKVTLLNSAGAMPDHAAQIENLTQAKVDALIIAMGKPIEADAQIKAAKDAKIPVVTVMSGSSPHALFDIQVNEYQVGAQSALYLLGQLRYQGNILEQRFDGNVGTRIRARVLDAVLAENTAVKVLGTHSMARTASWREDVKSGMEALLLKNQGKVDGIWASFDGQAYIIDDILTRSGATKGKPVLVSIDGGDETYRRIADPSSTLMATVAIPFEEMGKKAVDAVDQVVVKKQPLDGIVQGPYLMMDAVLVDKTNVDKFLKK